MCFVDVDGFEDDPELERQYPPPPPPPRPPSLYPHHNVFHLHRIHHHLFLLSNHLHTILSSRKLVYGNEIEDQKTEKIQIVRNGCEGNELVSLAFSSRMMVNNGEPTALEKLKFCGSPEKGRKNRSGGF
ncbi:hypothetical protein DY000_02021314 [Brassica cretica]|uniref:Uncharacterized protein n=1 Tax=Brassica cretica TaxID=69181 RepID=A0ABQ7EA46_BRACR|nr:hypothetical protein DY000_02021314 [Brassica cretica]